MDKEAVAELTSWTQLGSAAPGSSPGRLFKNEIAAA